MGEFPIYIDFPNGHGKAAAGCIWDSRAHVLITKEKNGVSAMVLQNVGREAVERNLLVVSIPGPR